MWSTTTMTSNPRGGAAEKAEQISGQKHIPVLLFEDGTVFVEPTNPQLTGKLKELGLIE